MCSQIHAISIFITSQNILSYKKPFVNTTFDIGNKLSFLRIRNEEALLEKELEGDAKYKKRVKYRLIPFVW